MSDPWWPEGFDLPAFRLRRLKYELHSGGDYVRGSAGGHDGDTLTPIITLPRTALRYPTRSLDPSALGAATKGIMFVSAFDYNTVQVEWAWPTSIEDTFQEVAVVRSTFGAPADPGQGQVIFRALRSGLPTMEFTGGEVKLAPPPIIYDQPLPSGHWYYYTAFFRTNDRDWTALMVDQCLLPNNYHHGDHMWNALPPWYQYSDDNYSIGNGFLRRFLSIVGFEQDRVRQYVEGVLQLHWIDRSPMQLLKHLGANYGYPYEQGIGDIRYRALLANLSQMLLKRGTSAGLLDLVETVSKYDCDITMGPNNTLLPDDSNFVTGTGHWAPIHPDVDLTTPPEDNFLPYDKVLLTLNTDVLPPTEAPGSLGSMLVDTSDTDSADIFIVAGAGKNADDEFTPYYSGIPVDPQEVYGFSMWIKMHQPSACTLYLIPFTDTGQIGDVATGGAIAATSPVVPAADTWTQLSTIGQVPDDGHYLVPGLYIDNRVMTGGVDGRSPRVDIAAVMVHKIESESPVTVQPPDRYLTMGDPSEKMGATKEGFQGFTLGAPETEPTIPGDVGTTTGRYFFTTSFRNALFANNLLMENSNLRLCFFRSAPSLDLIDPAWRAVTTKAELLATTGWVEVDGIGGYPFTHTINVSTRLVPIPDTTPTRNNRYVIINQYPFDPEPSNPAVGLVDPAPVEAIGVEYVGSIQAAGKVPHLPATAGRYISTPDKAALDITGDLEIVMRVAADDWSPSAVATLIGKRVGPDQSSWGVQLNTAGTLSLLFGDTGTGLFNKVSNANLAATPNGTTLWIKATLDVDNGSSGHSVRFYTAADQATEPSTWTQLGTTVTTAGIMPPLFSGSAPLEIGSFGTGVSGPFAGTVYKAIVRNGIGGTTVASPDFAATSAQSTVTDAQGNVFTISGSSITWVAGGMVTVTNPLIMVSTTPVGDGTNLYPRDALTANPNTNLGTNSNRYIFGWAEPPAGATTVDPIEGPLSIFKGAPDFEASNTAHVWLYPSRANMIANPSFTLDSSYWASNGAITLVPDPAPEGGSQAGHFAGSTPLIVESNVWETRMGNVGSEFWTLQLMAKGSGRCKVGLISWDSDYRSTACDWGDGETWELTPNAWIHIATIRRAPDAATAMLRIECADSGNVTIDKVLAERGTLKDWPYFDGDSKFSLQDSYTWYGGALRQGKSYSLWYDMRRSVVGRLFAQPVDTTYPGDVLSDAEVAEAGLVYQWVPAGVTVTPWLDVFYPGDTRPPPPAKGTTVQPYYSDSQRMGVINPWV